MKRIFADASIWVAAAGSDRGGSMDIMKVAALGKCEVLASSRLLAEAEKNILEKLSRDALARFYELLTEVNPTHVEDSTPEEENVWAKIVTAKDRHVLACSFKCSADILVSLDKKHLLADRVKYSCPFWVCTVRECINAIYEEML